jgi:hypothetical protein
MNIRRTGSSLSALLLVSAFALAACSSSAAQGSAAPGSTDDAGDSAAATLPGGAPDLPAAGGGSCSVTVTGDVSASWTQPQDMGSLLVTYWLSTSEREFLDMTSGDESFLMNCKSDQGSISLYSTNDTTAAQFPMAPGSYVVAASGILGGGDAGQVSALVTIGEDTLWRVPEAGTFNITTFDGHKFAGSFQFKIERLGDDLKTVEASATLSGTFDFGCTSGACS